MKHTSISLCPRSEKAVSELSEELDVSRSEVMRRLLIHAHESDSLPDDVLSGFSGNGEDGRTKREAIHTNGNPGRAPSLGRLSDVGGEQTQGDGMGEPQEESPASGERGDQDSDGTRNGFLDQKLW
jgi:hypothetical protein